ncbi:ATP-binding protein, partial [Streptomyces cyaneofuscatus]
MTVTESAPGLPAMVDVEVLWERLTRVEERVRHAVAARRATDPEPDDPYRGQYLTPDAVERVLESRDAFAPVPSYGAEPPSYVSPHRGPSPGRAA